ncbi:hypothetical protein [Mycolicibacterium fortuitum]|uniref:Uncharacterized protein n=2 Tax=Mycolicibacterium fortuitum TaxID=1766 RepID=A0AAE4VG18_MYCFO|nr:hypothetical protein [Mycolicibacterium fortuitum]MCV7137917.1 hypothetical protein [Mycolicibacterium fortuitum]MDV7194482.1 hypothetical protein [Mycolicibacterium fortuitum]MDV7207888.1 hypothetical protein [Mycolicibacterium fortuitum]MDV7229186.1 hypothetical protein [Mycolicibacterium fortuitum]MDV7260885.1 hypothetical protein [Mycolicibacterium fortuitum]
MDLDRLHPGDVSGHKTIRADLGAFGRELVVISGIACPDWGIDDDHVHREKCVLHLRERVDNVEHAAVHVGLASIANGESEFIFGTDATQLDVDAAGELVLTTDLALMGESSALSRFGYQIVLTTRKVTTEISGTISWATRWFRPTSSDPAGVSGVFKILANQRQVTQTQGGPGEFGQSLESLTPVTPGEITAVTVDEDMSRAHYRIVEPPKGVELKVTVDQTGMGTGVGFYAPNGDLVTVTVADPLITGIDFTGVFRPGLR